MIYMLFGADPLSAAAGRRPAAAAAGQSPRRGCGASGRTGSPLVAGADPPRAAPAGLQ